MSNDRFYRHLRPLIVAGIVQKTQERSGNRWGRTIYKLNHKPCFQCTQNKYPENKETENTASENPSTEKLHTNNTSFNSTSFNSTSESKDIAQALMSMFNEAREAANYKGRLRSLDIGQFVVAELLVAGISPAQITETAREYVGAHRHPAEMHWYKFSAYCCKKYHVRPSR